MNANGLRELTPEEEHKKDIYISLKLIQKDLVQLAGNVKCLCNCLEEEFNNKEDK